MARRLIILAAAAMVAGGIAVFAVILLSRDDARALTKTEYIARVNAVCRVFGFSDRAKQVARNIGLSC